MLLPFELSELAIITNSETEHSRNSGGIRTTRRVPGHYLLVKCKTRILSHAQARDLSGWLEELENGQVIDLVLPVASEPNGSALGTPVINNIDVNDGRRVIISGWNKPQSKPLLRGDFVRFNGHKKVYKVSHCGSTDSQGRAELILTKPLLHSVNVGESLHVRPSFCLSLESKLPEILEGNNAPRSYDFVLGEMWR